MPLAQKEVLAQMVQLGRVASLEHKVCLASQASQALMEHGVLVGNLAILV